RLRRPGGRDHGAGLRRRTAARRGAAGVQPVLARRPLAHPADRRHRPRPVDQHGGREAARWLARRVGSAGARQPVPAHASAAQRGAGHLLPAAADAGRRRRTAPRSLHPGRQRGRRTGRRPGAGRRTGRQRRAGRRTGCSLGHAGPDGRTPPGCGRGAPGRPRAHRTRSGTMTAMSRLAAGTLAVVLAGGLAAACGVPQWTDVVTEGSGPGAEPAGAAVPRVPPGPDEASDPKQLVQYFLQAAAADPGNAVEELRPFIHSSQQRDWQPNPQVWVVRVEGDPVFTDLANGQRVELTVQPIGILSDGVVEPRADSQPREYRFQVVSDAAIVDEQVGAGVDRVRYRVIDAPLAILLDQRALAERGHLRPTSVYVWDDDNNLLVPDLRWLPTAASPAQAAQAKLEWLIDGPAPWLESMSGLPGNLELQGNPVWREDHLDVAFTTSEELGKETLRRIDAQVWWTLRDLLPDRSTVSLTINGESREITGAHASARSIRYRSPDSFVLLGDRLVPYVPGDVAPPDIPLPSDTRSAALTSRGREVTLAVVHPAGEERLRLSLLTVDGIVGTDLTAGAMSRPVWLSHPSGTGLVVADGTLYRFTAGQTAVQEVVVPGLSRRITALSVAPDGRRLALVADGE